MHAGAQRRPVLEERQERGLLDLRRGEQPQRKLTIAVFRIRFFFGLDPDPETPAV